MNKKALIYGVVYSIVVIIFKLIIWLGGYTFTNFGFYFSIITSVFLIIPFYILAIKNVRDKDNYGIIAGKEAMRVALTIFAVGAVIISIYNYIEFSCSMKSYIAYYESDTYLQVLKSMQLKHPDKIKIEKFPSYIKEQIADLSAFRATTGKLLPMLIVGLSSAFMCAVFLKRGVKK